jgi:hypothetical protein
MDRILPLCSGVLSPSTVKLGIFAPTSPLLLNPSQEYDPPVRRDQSVVESAKATTGKRISATATNTAHLFSTVLLLVEWKDYA